jgi:SWIM zinc finger
MSVREQLTALVRRYDDDAWVALANRGLLRRATKDLHALDVHLVGEDADAVTVAVGEREVRVPVAGPSAATCSCPSAVICQHVLTACLWLAGAEATAVDPERLHEELMALDEAALAAHAGRAGLRWAHQLLADLDSLGEQVRIERSDYLSVQLPRPEVTVRYLGGGLDAMVLDQPLPQQPRLRVAAVLAWQQAHGLTQAPPAPPSGTRKETPLARARGDSRARVRRAVATLLADTVRTGVSHLSPAVHERYTTLATWAQGAEYHRLALHLRRLADEVELLLDRSARADDRRLLDDVALARGLVAALDHAAAGGVEPPALVGRARTAYDPVAHLKVVGLGGSPWRAGSGYHGLTCVFWAPERQRFLTWTDTRPESVPGFDPRGRWNQPGPWTGLDSPAVTAGRVVDLTRAQLSPEGRLSGVESTSARVTQIESDDLLAMLPVVETWHELATRERSRSLLDTPTASDRWAVVRPAGFGTPAFDLNRQLLQWPLVDAAGEVLMAELPWLDLHAHAVGRIESLGNLPAGSALVLRTRLSGQGVVGEPVSVVLPDRPINPVDALHFHEGRGGSRSRWVAAMRGRAVRDDLAVGEEGMARPPVTQLVDLRSWLEQQAERGTAGADAAAMAAALARQHQTLRRVGLHCFPELDPAVERDPAELLLRAHYLLRQVELALA